MIALLIAVALAQTPPPGRDAGNSFAKDVCSERDSLRSDRACYRAWLLSQREEVTRPRIVPADDPCDLRYTARTNGEFYADDHPHGYSRACVRWATRRHAERVWVTFEDVCGAYAAPDTIVTFTNEAGFEAECPPDHDNQPETRP